jgi:hypothetical protein
MNLAEEEVWIQHSEPSFLMIYQAIASHARHDEASQSGMLVNCVHLAWLFWNAGPGHPSGLPFAHWRSFPQECAVLLRHDFGSKSRLLKIVTSQP